MQQGGRLVTRPWRCQYERPAAVIDNWIANPAGRTAAVRLLGFLLAFTYEVDLI
jgi:hypothetical protein